MALEKTATKIIDNQTVGTSSSVDSSGINLSDAADFGVGFTLTFNASATAGAEIEVYADPAGASSSFTIGANDDPIDVQDIPVDAGNTVSGYFQLQRSPKYVKVRIKNLDASYTITAASAWSQVQTT